MKNKTIFAFDMGLASLGEAVKKNNKIVHAASLLIDADFASTKDQALRRRFYRTRQAHKEREKWLEKVWHELKLPGLLQGRRHQKNGKEFKVIPGDEKLEREFAAASKGDSTIYTSCLLRVMLLQGKKLEPWQIYKALRSSIQRRGYDLHVSWERNSNRQSEESENKKSTQESEKDNKKDRKHYEKEFSFFEEELQRMSPKEEYHYPCYYDAYKMGLWNPKNNKIKLIQNHEAQRARGYTASRDHVEKEIYELLKQAAKQFPKLKNKIGYTLYGEAGQDLPSLYTTKANNKKNKNLGEMRYHYETDHYGVLAQKKPRFDNRIVSQCCLIPKYNVCRAKDLLAMQATFLLQLKNLSYYAHNYAKEKLKAQEIRRLFEEAKARVKKNLADNKKKSAQKNILKPEDIAKCYKLTHAQWKKWLETNKGGTVSVVSKNDKADAPKAAGRSRFSRPALLLLKQLLLSGKAPIEFHSETVQKIKKGEYRKYKLEKSDLDFLKKIEDDWDNIYVPSMSLAERYLEKDNSNIGEGIKKIIFSSNNPVVRHRLAFFQERIEYLVKEYGEPDRVVMEFVREDFMGDEKKEKLNNFNKEQEKANEEANAELRKQRLNPNRKNKIKLILLKKQANICPYTGTALAQSKVESYAEEHIIPQRGGYNGPDAIWNKVVSTPDINRGKGERPPFEYITPDKWRAYQNRVEKMNLSNRTKKLLLARSREEVESLLERWYGLALTSWIARLARDMICLRFGWQPGEKGAEKKFHVISGGLTAKMRRKGRLNELLLEGPSKEPQNKGPSAKKTGKSRADKRHHALDAMVLAYASEWYRDKDNVNLFRFPQGIDQAYFKEHLDEVFPQKAAKSKVSLNETAYGRIRDPAKKEERANTAVTRYNLIEWLVSKKDTPKTTKNKVDRIVDTSIQEQILNFIIPYIKGKKDAAKYQEKLSRFLETLQQAKKKGALVKKVRVRSGTINTKKNLSKDQQSPGMSGQYYETKSVSGEGTKQHGYYLYWDAAKKPQIRAVYAFKSPYKMKKELKAAKCEIFHDTLFFAGMQLELLEPIKKTKGKLEKGRYTLKSFASNGNKIALTDPKLNVHTITKNDLMKIKIRLL